MNKWNYIGRALVIGKLFVGALLVHHGWSGEPANFYPFIFGIYMMLDVRLQMLVGRGR